MAGRQVEKIKEKKKKKKQSWLFFASPTEQEKRLKGRNKTEEHSRGESVFHIETVTFLCTGYYYNSCEFLLFRFVHDTIIPLSLSLLLSCNFLFNLGSLFVEQFTYVRMYVNVRASSLISYTRNSIRIGLEDASETSSPPPPPLSSCNRFVASFRPR